ncbi:hypothetical protein C0J08_15865 [Marinomonas sp. CT5]|uniref:hypothetical protein n=1 Tax=Marinomonas sp. CT5 TaxID=2066133 RepID=UPI001BAF8B5F|nr:hypothetical protein [Marinomonas sp. CT5]QUX96781.1 hypothetical protein C0J08_15865 [Marinomonas sp. CT5]
MELMPFKKVTKVPSGTSVFSDVDAASDLIDILSVFSFEMISATNKIYFRGISAYMFESQIKFGFNKNYKITDLEFRSPFKFMGVNELTYKGVNLFKSSLYDIQIALAKIGVSTREIDIGLKSDELGLSFFSSDYEKDLSVRLDAVTVHFN